MSSYFFLQAEKNQRNRTFISELEEWANANSEQTYVIDHPLGDAKYSYDHRDGLVVLVPKHKIMFFDFSDNARDFERYIEEFVEDLGSISDKFRYKEHVGRPKSWGDLIEAKPYTADIDVGTFLNANSIDDPKRQRVCELLISLLTGSINDIEVVRANIPGTLLDKIKQKILLFDGDQTRFVYQDPVKPQIRIQGLSGTGKTELLLHKLKEIYVSHPTSKIAFTCHNKILAESLKRRIPDFFNFMKVEQQIEWNSRLWCAHAWGSQSDRNSGIYRYICDHYSVQFNRYSRFMSFDLACTTALKQIRDLADRPQKPFDFLLIDESQDFPESFFDLCQEVTSSTVYVAGDIFQSIFDETVRDKIEPDYLLSKCYRTDPRTLMFAHSIGMGLFEQRKLRWLDDREWKACGYVVEKQDGDQTYILKREPLRRFEDLQKENVNSVEVRSYTGAFYENAADVVVQIVKTILQENPTAQADDVGVIFLDSTNDAYVFADVLEQVSPRELSWTVNKAYETKARRKGSLFVSNRNNVKGLEFPFVICVTRRINDGYSYRNALYMTLTRSFLKTYLVTSSEANQHVLPEIERGLAGINENGHIEVRLPSEQEREGIRTRITYTDSSISFFDFINNIFDELDVLPIFRTDLLDTVRKVLGEEFDYENAKEIIEFNYRKMIGE